MRKTCGMMNWPSEDKFSSQIGSEILYAVNFDDLLAITGTKPHTKGFR